MSKKIANRILKDLAYFLINGFLEKPKKHETEIIQELKSNLQKLATLPKEHSKAKNLWIENANELLQLLHRKDPRKFLRWNVIRRTMFVDSSPYIRREFSYLRKNNWDTVWKRATRETKVGCPAPFLFYPLSSENLIHNAYHLARFQKQIEEKVADADFIFEFGGGYGSMCRLIYNMGFKGAYAILDLPVFSTLQVFFLKMIGLNAELGINVDSKGISCVSELSSIEKIISRTPSKSSVFIGTWSISETSIRERNSILKLVELFDLFLIAYQKSFGEVDNVLFFNNWIKHMNDVAWYNYEISHLPNNDYLFGRKIHKNS